MSARAQEIANMVDMLPEGEQNLAYEIMRRMVLAWDPDYSKATPDEADVMERGLTDYERGETVRLDDI